MIDLKRPLPGKLLFVIIVAIVLSVLGLLTGVATLGTLAFGDQMMKLSQISLPREGNEPMKEAMLQYQQATQAGLWFALPVVLAKFVLSGLILWSSIVAAERAERGRVSLRRWFAVAIPVEGGALAATVFNQLRLIEPTREYYEAVMPPLAKSAAPMMIFGAVIAFVWCIAKVTYLVIGRRVLDNPLYRQYFAESSAAVAPVAKSAS